MKYIEKSPEPRTLINFKSVKYPKFKPNFDNLPPNVLSDIVTNLLYDQGFICCYTMDEITPETAVLIHLHPPAYHQERSLDYSNMFLALRQPKDLPPEFRVGYMSKGNTLIPDYISDERCAQFFRYNTLGEMIPADTYRTVKKCRDNFKKLTPEQQTIFSTIEVLNLNADRIKQQRKAIFNEVTNLAKKYSRAQLAKFAEKLKNRNKQGRFKRYCQVMIYYLENIP